MKAALLTVLVLGLAGCVAVGPRFQPEAPPSNDSALIYVYRASTFIGIANPDVPFLKLNGDVVGRMRIGGYIPLKVKAGRHALTTTESLFGSDTNRVRGEATVVVPSGVTLCLRYVESFDKFYPLPVPYGVVVVSSGDYRFIYVAEASAIPEISKTNRIF